LNNCQQLESIETWCGYCGNDLFGVGLYYLNENKLLEGIVKCSPKKFYELKIYYEDTVIKNCFQKN